MHPRLAVLLAAVVLSTVACADDDGATSPANDPAQFAAESLDARSEAQRETTAGPDSTTTTSEPPPLAPTEIPGEPVNQYDLRVRDCFDQIEDRRDGLPVIITTRLPCEDPHHFEVFAQLTYPAEHPSVFPGDGVIRDFALASCYRLFPGWVGRDYETSTLEIGVIVPTRENFENDAARYRGIHCWVEHVAGEPMVGTSRDSGW